MSDRRTWAQFELGLVASTGQENLWRVSAYMDCSPRQARVAFQSSINVPVAPDPNYLARCLRSYQIDDVWLRHEARLRASASEKNHRHETIPTVSALLSCGSGVMTEHRKEA